MLIKKEITGKKKENKIMRKGIILGIGIFIILLALAGTGSAKSVWTCGSLTYGSCHDGGNVSIKNYFSDIHKFNGSSIPLEASSCTHCHTNLSTTWLPLTSNGSLYNSTHRYNATTLASEILTAPACYNCHVDVNGSDFNLSTGTATYLTSSVCKDCHKAKYDNWTNTSHRVMLTDNVTAQAMNLPEPEVSWANISYVIVTKFQFDYINLTGYFLTQNDTYETETKEFINSTHKGGRYGTCGSCHTTGWNTTGFNYSLLNGILPGFNATSFAEPGIACERCHKPAGNGHQVVVNYSGDQCRECHKPTNHATGWENGAHAPPLNASTNSCSLLCHSPFDSYKNNAVTSVNATNVACGVCHNSHDITDSKYAATFSGGIFNNDTWADISDAKLSYFNATASNAADTDIFDILIPSLLFSGTDSRKDTSYGNAAINVTGPVSEVLCSMCHYAHGLANISGANLTHSRNSSAQSDWATCTDCHMQGANASVGKDMMKLHANDPYADVNKSCGSAKCHTTSTQNLSASEGSIAPIYREWNATAHNDKDISINKSSNSSFYFNATSGAPKSRANSCLKCHSPINWNPAIAESVTTSIQLTDSFKGIVCTVCHNIHDMGDWINKTGMVYAWYNRDAILSGSIYKANYSVMDNTTELCGNCHSNIRYGNTGPGWTLGANNPTSVHGYPAKDIFVGSWKQSSMLKFECIDCHMYINKTNLTGGIANDTEKITGHSFAVNAQGLQTKPECSGCHVNGTEVDTIENVIEKIKADTHEKWNSTNITVLAARDTVKAYTGVNTTSRDKIALAYWKLRNVYSDESWGVHDPVGTNKLLDDAVTLANDAVTALGTATSNVDLVTGWNLVALNGTPSATAPVSVLASVSSNITVVWGYNATSSAWELYDPVMPAYLDTLTTMVPGRGYWILATQGCKWTV